MSLSTIPGVRPANTGRREDMEMKIMIAGTDPMYVSIHPT